MSRSESMSGNSNEIESFRIPSNEPFLQYRSLQPASLQTLSEWDAEVLLLSHTATKKY